MRFAYATSRVAERRELGGELLDAEWLCAQGQGHDLTVLVDHDTPGARRLREAGIGVHVSPKRPMDLPDLGEVAADRVQARLLAGLHARQPLDCILYGADQTTDLSWLEPALAAVPRGVVLGGGPARDQRLVLDFPELFRWHGYRVWTAAGLVATADFLVADAPASDYGFRGALPPRLATRPARAPVVAAPEGPSLVLVVALSEDRAGLATLVREVATRVPAGRATIYVVVMRDVRIGSERASDLLFDGCPEELRQAVIVAAPGNDGLAAAFLERADVIVASRPCDLALPAVQDAAATPTLLLRGTPEPADLLGGAPLPQRRPTRAVCLPVGDTPSAAADRLDALDDAALDLVVLHAPDFADLAGRLAALPGLRGADVAVLARSAAPFGDADPLGPCLHVAGVARPVWPSVSRLLRRARTFPEFVLWLLDPSMVEHASVVVVPDANRGCTTLTATALADLPAWITPRGVLSRPQLGGLGGRQVQVLGQSTRAWAKEHRWNDRARLALPWKWGLLPRAMRGRW